MDREQLLELISEKVDEIFLAYQNANNITNGDIHPYDALRLDHIMEELADHIEKVGNYQAQTSYTYQTDIYTDTKNLGIIDMDKFFYEVSNIIAFADCTNFTITDIRWRGKKVEYKGWQPNMVFEYTIDGETIWIGQFENWDH